MASETDALGNASTLAMAIGPMAVPAVGQFQPNTSAIWSITKIAFSRKDVLGKKKPMWDLLAPGDSLVITKCDDPGACLHFTCLTVTKYLGHVLATPVDLVTSGAIKQNDRCVVTLVRCSAERSISRILTGDDGAGGFEILFGPDGEILTS